MPNANLTINKALFITPLADVAPAQRVLRLIETRQRVKIKYSESYRGIITALEAVRSESDPGIMGLSAEQRAEIEQKLLAARDETARGFSQALLMLENTINEQAPGTFPRDDLPLTSFDLGGWIRKGLDILSDLLDWIGDLFDGLGMGFAGDGCHAGADGLDALSRYLENQGLLPPLEPEDDD